MKMEGTVAKKIGNTFIVLLIIFLLNACGNTSLASPANLPPTSTGSPSNIPDLTPATTLSATPSLTLEPYHTPTPTPSSTATSTPDYAALGLPSPTATMTFDYVGLAAHYLTPFTPRPIPTFRSTHEPTANVANILSHVVIRKVTPQPPPILKIGPYDMLQNPVLPAFVQSVTDLMNYADGNRELYLQYIVSLVPTALDFSPDDWFLENDYDHDGQPEWLVSVPIQSGLDGVFHCGDLSSTNCARAFFLFEKIGDVYRPVHILSYSDLGEMKVTLVEDLNNNHRPEIVFRADPCGSACSTYLQIAEWDGQNWKDHGISKERSKVTFADLDGNGTIEIRLEYSTGARNKYNHPYPYRENLVDIYGWRNEGYEIVDQIRPPTDSIYATIWDINSALAYKNAEMALGYAKPFMERLDQSCDQMKAYIGIQTMLVYALENDQKSMQATLARLEQYCDLSTNAYVHVAKILWLAYQRSHDVVAACQAMDRFRQDEYPWNSKRVTETYFLNDSTIHIPDCDLK